MKTLRLALGMPRGFGGWMSLVVVIGALLWGFSSLINVRSFVAYFGALTCAISALYLVWACVVGPIVSKMMKELVK